MKDREKPLVQRAELHTRRVLAVSDIHGDRELFLHLLDKLRYVPGEDTLVLLGDYVNRGPQNLETVRTVMELCKNENVYALRGNNDVYLLRHDPENFRRLGFFRERSLQGQMIREAGLAWPETPEAFDEAMAACHEVFQEELGFLYGLPDILETGRFFFAHAGLQGEDLDNQELSYVLSAYGFFTRNTHAFSKLLLVGHYPTANFITGRLSCAPVYDAEHRVLDIDGGNCIKTIGQLNGVILDNRTGAWSWESVDRLREIPAPVSQRGRPGWQIVWDDSRMEILERGEKTTLCRHCSSGRKVRVPNAFLFRWQDQDRCDDFSTALLEVERGEPVGLIADLGDALMIRKNGEAGLLLLDHDQKSSL